MGKDNGGPAFPEIGNVGYGSEWQNESGMTLRDYFAAKALVAIYAGIPDAVGSPREMAKNAYVLADAMLEARNA